MPILFGKQKQDAPCKKQKRYRTPVMHAEAMPEGQDPDQKSQPDHAGFKPEIVDDIHSENRQPRQKKR